MSSPSCGPWLDRPLAGAFLAFNLLPVGLMHPSRQAAWHRAPDTADATESTQTLHVVDRSRRLRHASRAHLQQLDEDEAWVEGFNDPALPVFMASQTAFERLAIFCGLVCLIPAIRRIITREDLQAVRAELSAQEFEFARGGGARWVPHDLQAQQGVSLGHVRTQARALGDHLLFFAIASASPAVACRARLRLPVDLSTECSPWPPTLQDGGQALNLARGLLQELDAEWMSLFPTSP